MSLSTEAKVGTVSILGLILLAFMVVYLGGYSFGEKGYPVYAVFNQVGGLKGGNAVRYAGVDIGRVDAIDVVPSGVKVRLMINPGTKIPEGSKFFIGADGLLGEKFVEIVPPPSNSGILAPGAVVKGEEPQGLDQLISNADKVLLDVQKLVQSLNDVLGDEKVKAAMKETMLNTKELTARLNEFSAVLARMAQNNEADVNTMVQNLSLMSGNLREVTARVDRMLATLDNNGQTASDMREMIQNLKVTSARVEKMAAALEGVVTDPETAGNIKTTLRNAKEASAKANNMLDKINNISMEGGFEVLGNTDSGKRVGNADVRINTGAGKFVEFGAQNIGDNQTESIQVGQHSGSITGRMGMINSQPGIGVDTALGNNLKFSVDVYDPNDVRVKLRTQLKVAPDLFLVGQADGINKDADKNTYVGIRRNF